MKKQPDPLPNNSPHIVDQVIKDLQKRKELGIEHYGVPLQPFNGRDAFRDMYEEMLDMVIYARQVLTEIKEHD